MTLVIDAYVPFIVEAVQNEWPDVDICSLKPEQIDADAVQDADALIVRTRTKVDEQLLAGSKVRLVCTATIGFDHIDTAYCDSHNISWISCPGCNAQAVCDYIEEAINTITNHPYLQIVPTGKESPITNTPTLGVVGVGHVGSRVAKMAERRGMKVLLNDPPKGIGVSLDAIAQNCDIITFHVPLDMSTYHLCDEAFLAKCKPGALIINAARGGVVDEQALLRSGHPYILDTWENEPDINPDVLQKALLASMHIAGYSVEGKRNASQRCLDEIAQTFGLPPIDIAQYRYNGITGTRKNSSEPWLAAITRQLKESPTAFEALRKAYPLREG
jgi:erythronate-4-phosphate dehydrogenase